MTGEQIGGIVRLILASGGGWVIATFGVTASQWETIVGGLAVLVAGLWSYFSKKKVVA